MCIKKNKIAHNNREKKVIVLKCDEHIILGLFLAFGLDYYYLNLAIIDKIFYYPLIALGSILPDIDHPKSFIGSKTRPISDIIYKCFSHRGITHSLFIVGIIFIIAYFLWGMNIVLTGITLGAVFHILGDMLTPSGCCLLYPLKKRRYKLKR